MSTPYRCDISVSAGSPIACEAVVFRQRGHLRVTAIVKATFALVADGVMTVAPPSEIIVKERFSNRSPTASLQAASDLSPHRPRVDVTFAGHAYAPGGSACVSSVRLAVFRGSALVDKTINVYGDRTYATAAAPRPFDRMPIVYERAYAVFDDPSIAENPAGVATPNLVDPRDAKRPVGFGPISRYWPSRKRLLGAIDAHGLDPFFRGGAETHPEIPEAFDWRYFQSAPPDQQIDTLHGDEWIVLDGLHPTSPRLASRLPSALAVARVHGRAGAGNGAGEPLLLIPDTVAIDGDRQSCDVVWRGSLAVAGGEAALSSLRIVADLELPGRPVAWTQQAPAAARRPVVRTELGGVAARTVTPFDGKRDAPASASPYARASGPVVRRLEDHDMTGTVIASTPLRAVQVMPFHAAAGSGPARPDALAMTAAPFSHAARAATPFEGKPASPASASPYARSAGAVVRNPDALSGTVLAPHGMAALTSPATPFERRDAAPAPPLAAPVPVSVEVPVAPPPAPPALFVPPPEPPPPAPPALFVPPPEPPAPFVPPPEPPASIVPPPELPVLAAPPPEPPVPVARPPEPYAEPYAASPDPPAPRSPPPPPPPLAIERPAASAVKGGFYAKFSKKK
jgi:hypothetical protein